MGTRKEAKTAENKGKDALGVEIFLLFMFFCGEESVSEPEQKENYQVHHPPFHMTLTLDPERG
jgi:hypothetical protein